MTDDIKVLNTGISGLDSIMRGGFPAAHTYLIKGEPGTGKTTLVMQFLSHGVNQGESAVYVSFSESLQELKTVADAHGWPLDKIDVAELSTEISERSASGSSIFHSAEIELPEVIAKIIKLVKRVKPTRLGIDSLTELRNMADSDRAYRRALFQIKATMEEMDVTTLFVGAIGGRTKLESESLAHGVIELQVETPLYGPSHRSLEVKKLRGRAYETGFHDYTIVTGGLEVFPRIRPKEVHRTIAGVDPIKSGIDALDQLVGGGLDRGTNCLVLGPSGTGKSSIVMHYALAAAERGEKAVIYSFDEDVGTIQRRADATELPLSKFMEEGLIRIEAVDAAELSPGHFAHIVREDVTEKKINLLAIDSLNGYAHAMPSETALVPHLHDLLVYLGAQGVLVLLTMPLRGLFATDAKRMANLNYLADTILLLRYREEGDRIYKSIVTVKQRTRDHDKAVRRLSFGKGGIHIGEPESAHPAQTDEPAHDKEEEAEEPEVDEDKDSNDVEGGDLK